MSEPTVQKNSAELTWTAVKGLLGLFVTPLSIIAVIFIWTTNFCRYLFTLLNKDNCINSIYTIGIYFCLGIVALTSLVVLGLTIFRPDNLIYDKEASLKKRGMAPFGQDGTTAKNKETTTTTPPSTFHTS